MIHLISWDAPTIALWKSLSVRISRDCIIRVACVGFVPSSWGLTIIISVKELGKSWTNVIGGTGSPWWWEPCLRALEIDLDGYSRKIGDDHHRFTVVLGAVFCRDDKQSHFAKNGGVGTLFACFSFATSEFRYFRYFSFMRYWLWLLRESRILCWLLVLILWNTEWQATGTAFLCRMVRT